MSLAFSRMRMAVQVSEIESAAFPGQPLECFDTSMRSGSCLLKILRRGIFNKIHYQKAIRLFLV